MFMGTHIVSLSIIAFNVRIITRVNKTEIRLSFVDLGRVKGFPVVQRPTIVVKSKHVGVIISHCK